MGRARTGVAGTMVTPMEVAALRRALDGRTQRWLAKRSGVNEKTISNILRGYVTRTHRADYDRIVRALMGLPTTGPSPGPAPAPVDLAAVD